MDDPKQVEILLAKLAEMPAFLRSAFGGLTEAEAREPGPDGAFSPVEHCWHLADLEREGFGARIERLLAEHDPHLPDFDGAAVAAQRQYRSLDLVQGIASFEEARQANLERLRRVGASEWGRRGRQDGVGEISLSDIPRLMDEHDTSHVGEITAWREGGESARFE